jgi:hypothetical protein
MAWISCELGTNCNANTVSRLDLGDETDRVAVWFCRCTSICIDTRTAVVLPPPDLTFGPDAKIALWLCNRAETSQKASLESAFHP